MFANRGETRIFNGNRFKLGLFGFNCSGGLSLTKAPERWDASWEHCVRAARLADDAGLEFLLPIGRWHGYKGEADTQGTTFETLTWACGLLALTRGISVFGTLHVAFVNPVFAAKQIVTADHIGQGRFGLNVVSGWNPLEFDSFGADLRDHDDRYAYSAEWLDVARKIWTETEPFDHDGAFFKLKGVLGKPKPWWGSHPVIVSAGNSETGKAFASNNADCLFTTIPSVEAVGPKLAAFRALATGARKNMFASCHMMVRPTTKEARDYHHYIVHEQGDWAAAEFAEKLRGARISAQFEKNMSLKERLITGAGFPIIAGYDEAVETMTKLADAGVDGLACGMINYIDDFKHIEEGLLPRMERAGLRQPRVKSH